jgi:putative lipoic acid-binding regulatory protein
VQHFLELLPLIVDALDSDILFKDACVKYAAKGAFVSIEVVVVALSDEI